MEYSLCANKRLGKKVFPNLSEDKAIEKLWDAIFKCSRVDGQDPIKAWEEHNENLNLKWTF